MVGIERTEGWLEIFRVDGRSQCLAPSCLRRGEDLVRALEERWEPLFYHSADE